MNITMKPSTLTQIGIVSRVNAENILFFINYVIIDQIRY